MFNCFIKYLLLLPSEFKPCWQEEHKVNSNVYIDEFTFCDKQECHIIAHIIAHIITLLTLTAVLLQRN